MAEKLLILSLTTAWSTAASFGFPARTLTFINRGSVPVEIRYEDGDAVVRLEPQGEAGSSRVLSYQRSAAPTAVAGRGVGGSATVTVEASQEARAGGGIPAVIAGAAAALSSATPQALGPAATAGVASTGSRADHVHGLPLSDDTPAALGGTAVPGGSTDVSRADHVHPFPFDTTDPEGLGTAAAPGSANVAARRDHVHPLPLDTEAPAALGTAAAPGSAPVAARRDHVHPLPLDTEAPAALGTAAAPGSANVAARRDHVHPFPTVQGTVGNGVYYAGAPLAAANDYVHALFAASDAGNAFPGPFNDPTEPRNIVIWTEMNWQGGDVTVVYVDQYGAQKSVTVTPVMGALELSAVAASFVSASKAVSGSGGETGLCSIGIGSRIGVVATTPGGVQSGAGLLVTSDNQAGLAATYVNDAWAPVDPAQVPDGARSYSVVLPVEHAHPLA